MIKEVKLGDIAELKTGPFGTQLHANEYVSDGIPVINVRNIGYGEILPVDMDMVSIETLSRLSEHRLSENDIVFGRKGSIDRHAFIDKRYDGWMQGSDCIRVRIRELNVNPRYVSHYLKLDRVKKQLTNGAVGSTMPSMNTDILKDILVLLPSEAVQDDIEKVLTSIESKIENNNAIYADLEAMAKLLYDYWFVQFDFPDENGKPYKSSGGKMVWNEDLKREIPEGWEVGAFSDCVSSINTGLNPRDNFKLNIGGTIRYLTVKNLTKDGSIDFSFCDMIDEDARRIVHRRSDVSVGDILFASIAPLGRCAVIIDPPEDWDINESVFSIRPNYKNMTSLFLYMTFMSDMFIKKAEGSSTGSVFKGIRISELLDLKTIIPPKQILDMFEDQIKNLFLAKTHAFTENQQLASLRDFLLPMLMNGQVKVGGKGDLPPVAYPTDEARDEYMVAAEPQKAYDAEGKGV